MPEIDPTRTAIDVASHVAGLALSNIGGPPRLALEALPSMVREALIIRTALAYLLGHGLLAPTDALLAEPQWLALDIAEPYRADLAKAMEDALDRQARIVAALGQR